MQHIYNISKANSYVALKKDGMYYHMKEIIFIYRVVNACKFKSVSYSGTVSTTTENQSAENAELCEFNWEHVSCHYQASGLYNKVSVTICQFV